MVSLVQRLEESMRFELMEHFCSSVFKTDAINQTLPTFHTWSFLLESNQRLIVFTTKLIPQMVERTGIKPVLFTLIVTVLTLHHLSIFYRHTILVVSFDHRKIAISMSYVRIRLYSSAVDVYTLRCLSHFNDCGF